MRIAMMLAFMSLAPSTAISQPATDSSSGHFEGWPLSSQWGADKQAFEATITMIRPILGLLTVAENGFGWRRAFTDSVSSFTPWNEISGWCAAPESLLVRTREPERIVSYEDIDSNDLTEIVDSYFRAYAANAEPSGPDIVCDSGTLRTSSAQERIDARRQIIRLLEDAETESR